MTLGRDLSESAAAIRVPTRTPDRVEFHDPDLVSYLGYIEDGGFLHRPVDELLLGLPWLPISDFHRLRTPLTSWKFTSEYPAPKHLDDLFDEAEWASKSVWKGERVAWIFGERRAVIQSPYTVTLAEELDSLASPYRWSSVLRGWIVSRVDADAEDLERIFETYEITPSSKLADHLTGRGGWEEQLAATVERAKAEGYVLPGPFKSGRVLRPWQEVAILALASSGSTLLADQVGLGKGGEFTCGLLCLNAKLEAEGLTPAYPAVFSVTKSMKDEIVEEILRWKHDARIVVVDGKKASPIDPRAEFVVLNHDILESRKDDLLDIRPRAFVADEAHVFKNEKAKRSAAALAITDAVRKNAEKAGTSEYIVLASGTPFLNTPLELWSTLGILGKQDYFSSYALKKIGTDTMKIRTPYGWKKAKISPSRAFEIRWCDGHYDKFAKWINNGFSNTSELNRLLVDTGMVRRRKSDILHPLPDLTESITFLEPSDLDFEEYLRVDEEFREWVIDEARRKADEEDLDPEDAVRIVIKKLESGGEGMMRLTALRRTLAGAKIDPTVEWIHSFMDGSLEVDGADGTKTRVGDDPDRRKLIVFVHHKEPRSRLVHHPELQQYGVVTILAGDEQDGPSIQEAKERFQTDPNVRLIICTMAAREGHTLTAARDVLLVEIPFVPSWVVQMAGRCWARLSELFEPHEATIHYAVVRGTEDARSIRRVRLKKAVFDAVIDSEGQDEDIRKMQDEELEGILDSLAIGAKELGVAR